MLVSLHSCHHAAMRYWPHWCGQRLLQWRLDDD